MRARPFAQKLVEISRHEEDSSEDQEEEEEGEFLDNRWRLISLHPHGQRWEESIAALDAQRLSSSGEPRISLLLRKAPINNGEDAPHQVPVLLNSIAAPIPAVKYFCNEDP